MHACNFKRWFWIAFYDSKIVCLNNKKGSRPQKMISSIKFDIFSQKLFLSHCKLGKNIQPSYVVGMYLNINKYELKLPYYIRYLRSVTVFESKSTPNTIFCSLGRPPRRSPRCPRRPPVSPLGLRTSACSSRRRSPPLPPHTPFSSPPSGDRVVEDIWSELSVLNSSLGAKIGLQREVFVSLGAGSLLCRA
jgi:hypothetical protein